MRADRASSIDIDLRGHLGLRLIDATAADLALVERALGRCEPSALSREPDLRVRFVDRLRIGDLRYLDGQRAGFSEEGFFVRSGGGRRAMARVPFDAEPGTAEIVCERGGGDVPFLIEFLRLAALTRGIVGLHASAFEYRGTGVLVIGWPHGGKTSALLAFAEHGARLVGDDLVFLTDGGRRMFGLAAPIELSDWQIRQVPRLPRELRTGRRLLTGCVRALDRLQAGVPDRVAHAVSPVRFLRAALSAFERRLRVRLPAEAVFPGEGPGISVPGPVLLMLTHELSEIRVEAVDAEDTLQRLVHMARADGLSFLRSYFAFRFAFPGRTSDRIENAHAMEAALLRRALAGRQFYVVRHPRPVSLRALHAALAPLCDGASRAAGYRSAAAAPAAVGGVTP